jgi:hypothetical protein
LPWGQSEPMTLRIELFVLKPSLMRFAKSWSLNTALLYTNNDWPWHSIMPLSKNNPGIRVPLTEAYIAEFPNQFKPYHNMFGCNLRNCTTKGYDGTLFRLPCRLNKILIQISQFYFFPNFLCLNRV